MGRLTKRELQIGKAMREARRTTVSHTPGPWELSDNTDVDGRRRVIRDGYAVALVCSRASSPASGSQYFEKDANARLIAAAPELLAACKAMMAKPETRDVDRDYTDFDVAIDAMRSAVLKAEGR